MVLFLHLLLHIQNYHSKKLSLISIFIATLIFVLYAFFFFKKKETAMDGVLNKQNEWNVITKDLMRFFSFQGQGKSQHSMEKHLLPNHLVCTLKNQCSRYLTFLVFFWASKKRLAIKRYKTIGLEWMHSYQRESFQLTFTWKPKKNNNLPFPLGRAQ